MKKLLIMMEKDWKAYTTGPENSILHEWARFGRKVTIYYAGIYLKNKLNYYCPNGFLTSYNYRCSLW